MLLTTYECDPEKNVLCPKDCCQKECFATTRLEFAKLDEDGQPIVHEVWEMPDVRAGAENVSRGKCPAAKEG